MKSLILLASLLASSLNAQTLINGAGATFPFPLYSKWFSEYQKQKPEVAINYQSIGSGGGIRQFSDSTIDFGATDAPMNEEQIGKLKGPAMHFPTTLGAVVISYNLPGIGNGLKLTGDVIAQIYLGTIKKWEDPKITSLNPGKKLAGDIVVTHRSDGSGTSAVFTDYLAKVSPSWKEKVGQGTAVNWPVGLGGKGNEGVAGLVKQTPGSIGYVEFIYAESNKLPYASLKNQSGNYVLPSTQSVTAAADANLKSIPEDFRVSITDASGKDSYPLSSFTYILVYKTQSDATKGKILVDFLRWAVKDGQKFCEPLHYSKLPKSLVSKIEAKIETIETKKL
mgnify:CR=1 FL=1